MKINVLSDLHLEFEAMNHEAPKGTDLVILAGDIGVHDMGIVWAKWIADDIPIVYIAGNHEFYKGAVLQSLYKRLKTYSDGVPNLFFLQNDELKFNDYRVLGCTLWTDFLFDKTITQEQSMNQAPFSMYDYRTIMELDLKNVGEYKMLQTETVLAEHLKSKKFLEEKLAEPFDGKTIVVTHHGVSEQSIADKWKYGKGNEYFVSDLSDLILQYQPELWVHGHTHSCLNYQLGNTQVVVNPRGYVQGSRVENPEFNPNKIVEI